MNSTLLFSLCRLSDPPVREVAARGLRYLERLGAIRLEPRRRVTILDRLQLANIAGNRPSVQACVDRWLLSQQSPLRTFARSGESSHNATRFTEVTPCHASQGKHGQGGWEHSQHLAGEIRRPQPGVELSNAGILPRRCKP